MKKYNHAFDIAFSVISKNENGDDITAEEFAAAIRQRVDDLLSSGELLEAVGAPWDTYEQDPA